MNITELKDLLLYTLAINYAVLLIWFGAFAFAHDTIYRLHSRWFKLSIETFDAIHYAAMATYKLAIFMLNLAPLLALHWIKAG